MGSRTSLILILVAGIAFLVSQSVFTVDEREYALKLKFGEIVRTDFEPGLHFKIPLVNNVVKFPDVILTRNNPTEQFLTEEKKNLNVDFYVKWRVIHPGQYYRAVGADEMLATSRLIEIIKDGIRAEFATRTVQEVVTADRREIMDQMLVKAREVAKDLGIEVVDVRVKRMDLPEDVSESVFARMRQERGRVAAQLRAEGAERAERIRADADRERTVILADAYRRAQEIRGEGDATAAAVYAKAYDANREFYAFYRSLESYRRALGQDQDLFVIGPDSDFFRYLNDPQGGERP